MIIYGSTSKEKLVESTEFFCPTCREQVDCDHMKVARYFTLYFIPLFPIGTVGEYIRCDTCGGEFDTEVLDMSQDEIEDMVKPWKCGECGNSNPPSKKRCIECKCYRDDE